MNIIFILIAVSLVIALVFLVAFIWATSTDQYEDTDTPAIRVLFDNHKNQSLKK